MPTRTYRGGEGEKSEADRHESTDKKRGIYQLSSKLEQSDIYIININI
jgi:hypothetical protein